MGKVVVDLGMSLDGYVAGPNAGPDNPLGDDGTRIHQWVYGLQTFRERLCLGEGGETGADDDVVKETFSGVGAYVMGRRMFDEGEVGWPERAPFRAPVFVVTSSPREPWVRPGGTTFTFVGDGLPSALKQAREAAGDLDVRIAGGAHTVRQFLEAGMVDEMQLHVAPLLLGGGNRLFDGMRVKPTDLEQVRAQDSPAGVTHLTFSLPGRQ